MPIATHTWTFTGDAEGLIDNGESASLGFGYGGDNAVRFSCTGSMITATDSGIGDFTETWQDWGVPYNSLVTDLQITGFSKKVVTATNVSAHVLLWIDVYKDATNCVTGTNHLVESRAWSSTTTDSSYVAQSGGPVRTLLTPLVSSDNVALKIHHFVMLNPSGNSVVGYDDITLEITYEPHDEVADLDIDNCVMTIVATEPSMFTITDLVIDDAQLDMTSDEMGFTLPIDNAQLQFYCEPVTFGHVFQLDIDDATMSIVSAGDITDFVTGTSHPPELVGTMPTSQARLVRQIVGNTRLIS